jgi:hypothetical protein
MTNTGWNDASRKIRNQQNIATKNMVILKRKWHAIIFCANVSKKNL